MSENNTNPPVMEVDEAGSSSKDKPSSEDKNNKSSVSSESAKSAQQAGADAAKAATDAAIPTPAAEDDLGKVQELLFGNQLRAINQKIMLVHKDFKQTISDLDRKIDKQLNDQDTAMKKELAGVVDQLRAETKARENAVESSGVEIRKASNNLQDRISAMEKTHAASKAAVEDQLTQNVRELERKLEQVQSSLQAQIDGARNTLDDNKVDRAALSELLGGIAQQISSIDNIPTVTQRTEEAANASAAPPNTRTA